jgi:ubiquinone/menaquinone biosynthesis C-methylase UbiE
MCVLPTYGQGPARSSIVNDHLILVDGREDKEFAMGVTTQQELEFERAAISKRRELYLATDVTMKVWTDPGYAEKVRILENALGDTKEQILDVGANTCGEAEYLTTRGYNIIANDVNEIALDLSRERCARYGRSSPQYLACDAQHLNLGNEKVSFVIFNESLHHMPEPARALAEASRVLTLKGKIFLYEPYAYNPYRRLSEIRDYFRGTVEKSFGVRELKRLLSDAGFNVLSVERHVCAASEWKLAQLSMPHRLLRRLYVFVGKKMLWLFGNVMIIGEKRA